MRSPGRRKPAGPTPPTVIQEALPLVAPASRATTPVREPLKKAIDDLNLLQQLEQLDASLQDALDLLGTVQAEAQAFQQQRAEAETWSRTLDSQLADIYQNPHLAREALDAFASHHGHDRAAAALATFPEQFGALAVELESRLAGLVQRPSTAKARANTRTAAATARTAWQAAAAIDPNAAAAHRDSYEQARHLTAELRSDIGEHPSAKDLAGRIAVNLSQLTPEELAYLASATGIGADRLRTLTGATPAMKPDLE